MSHSAEVIRSMITNGQDITVELSSGTAALVSAIVVLARQRGEDRTFEHWLEEVAIAGCEAKQRSWKYSDDTRNDREFNKACLEAGIKFVRGIPDTLIDQIKYAELCVKHHKYNATHQDVMDLKKQLQAQAKTPTKAA